MQVKKLSLVKYSFQPVSKPVFVQQIAKVIKNYLNTIANYEEAKNFSFKQLLLAPLETSGTKFKLPELIVQLQINVYLVVRTQCEYTKNQGKKID